MPLTQIEIPQENRCHTNYVKNCKNCKLNGFWEKKTMGIKCDKSIKKYHLIEKLLSN